MELKRDRIARLVAISVLVTGFALRTAVIFSQPQSLKRDPDSYARLATTWAATGTFGFENQDGGVRPTAFRPPLYPWLLSWIAEVTRVGKSTTSTKGLGENGVPEPNRSSAPGAIPWIGVATLHCLISIGSLLLIYSIARSLGVPHAWLPVAAWACDPLLLRAGQLVMTEVLAASLVLAAWRLWLWLVPGRSIAKTTTGTTASDLLPEGDILPETEPGRKSLFKWLGLGVIFGLAILARPTAAPWALLCGAALLVILRRPIRFWACGLVAVGILTCIGPWTIRNSIQLGKPVWATTHGGYTLLLANNPNLYEHFRRHGPSRGWDAEPFHAAWAFRHVAVSRPDLYLQPTQRDYWFADRTERTASQAPIHGVSTAPPIAESNPHVSPPLPIPPAELLGEIADDDLAYASAWACIARSPAMFALASFYRVGWFWALWPYSDEFSWSVAAIGLWYSVWFTLAIWGCCSPKLRADWSRWLPAGLLIVSLTAVHAVYWSNMRMRGPVMSCIYLAASMPVCLRKTSACSDDQAEEA